MELTLILKAAHDGDAAARAELIQAVYDDLCELAACKMRAQKENHTLSSTALVHEVSMRLLTEKNLPADNRRAFFAYASKAMRNFLIDHARRKGSQKRGGHYEKVSLDNAMVASNQQCDELLALDEALTELASFDDRKASVVEMRYFGGLNNSEIAEALDVSIATIKRDWEVARTWLFRRLHSDKKNSQLGPSSENQSKSA